ncbi:MAG: hypothetical protein M3336_08175 [Chloroflexota bacterium]|nr:hypothetical protein [Chloroflexota bacterium]
MLRLLTTVTLGYLGVLISALAASLIAILVQLRRIDRALADVAAALTRVRDHTAPLGGHLETIQAATGTFAERMQASNQSLGQADAALADVAIGR